MVLPFGEFGDEALMIVDSAVEALPFEDADFDLDHVEPAGVLRRVVELDAAEQASRLGCRECGVEGGGGMGRQVVEDDPDTLGLWKVEIDEFAHGDGEVVGGAALGNLDVAPGAMGVESDEEIGGAVAAILIVEALRPARLWRDF